MPWEVACEKGFAFSTWVRKECVASRMRWKRVCAFGREMCEGCVVVFFEMWELGCDRVYTFGSEMCEGECL